MGGICVQVLDYLDVSMANSSVLTAKCKKKEVQTSIVSGLFIPAPM